MSMETIVNDLQQKHFMQEKSLAIISGTVFETVQKNYQ